MARTLREGILSFLVGEVDDFEPVDDAIVNRIERFMNHLEWDPEEIAYGAPSYKHASKMVVDLYWFCFFEALEGSK